MTLNDNLKYAFYNIYFQAIAYLLECNFYNHLQMLRNEVSFSTIRLH